MSAHASARALPSETPHRSVSTGLAKIGLALRHHAWREGRAGRLTPTQAQALAVLRGHEGARVTDLADELAISQPTASDAVTALVRKGLVERTTAPDRRARRLRLTPRGRREADRVAEWPDLLLSAVDALEPDEQGALLRGLSTMIRVLQEEGRIPVARMCITCRFFQPSVHDDPERPHHCAFVDAPFGERALRLDCADFRPHDPKELP